MFKLTLSAPDKTKRELIGSTKDWSRGGGMVVKIGLGKLEPSW